jgi:IPTL-CTERM motif
VATTPTFNAPAGTYTLTVTNALCESATSAPFTVTQNPPLQATIGGRGYVANDADRDPLTAGFNGTVAGYVWRDAQGTIVGSGPTFNGPAGTYTVTITDATCGSATWPAFAVIILATTTVPTASDWGLLALASALAALAFLRMR